MAKLIDSEFNQEVKDWTSKTEAIARREMKKLGIGSKGSNTGGVKTFKGRVYSNKFGEASQIGFGMKKHMVFVHKGVGRGYPIEKVNNAQQSGNGLRFAKPFLNPVLDKEVPKLADKLVLHAADAAVNSIKIR